MKRKLDIAKFGGFFLALVILIALYIVLTLQANAPKEAFTSATAEVVFANNVSMNLLSAHTEAGGYRTEICYDLPDQRDWQLTYPNERQNTILSVDDIRVSPFEEGTMYWRYDQNGKIVQRCQFLFFVVKVPLQAESVSLSIGKLYVRKPGQSDFCLEISQEMAERNYTITIDCTKPNGFDQTVYVRFPTELLSMDPVFKSIFKDTEWDFYSGPWSFTFPVNPK